ncbi:MAG: hypothetical protein U5N26_05610 [Candidatus Marinimicrobia bacterium]|nr:hypothetical protein [Candidatus Neomarinimicrobiota bacterium]
MLRKSIAFAGIILMIVSCGKDKEAPREPVSIAEPDTVAAEAAPEGEKALTPGIMRSGNGSPAPPSPATGSGSTILPNRTAGTTPFRFMRWKAAGSTALKG